MAIPLTIEFETAIHSVNLLTDPETQEPCVDETTRLREQLESVRQEVRSLTEMLEAAAAQVKEYYQQLTDSHRDQIVRLSIGIAEKILMKQIQAGQYDIEKIVSEALLHAPAGENIRLRLSPKDMETLAGLWEQADKPQFHHVELIVDPKLNPAECVAETDKGIVESLLAEHLRQIETALTTGPV
ncbi:MAG: hypothetical protein JW828_16180 [Sedimentisphaerales bacterium]|nr:hypothetical protein [Sedimentisphaerales bacterium]